MRLFTSAGSGPNRFSGAVSPKAHSSPEGYTVHSVLYSTVYTLVLAGHAMVVGTGPVALKAAAQWRAQSRLINSQPLVRAGEGGGERVRVHSTLHPPPPLRMRGEEVGGDPFIPEYPIPISGD